VRAFGVVSARAVGGALLGVGLAAVVLIPFAELLGQSGIWEVRGKLPRNTFVLPPAGFLTAIAPDLFGNPVLGADYGPFNYNERIAYAGFLPLFLALLSLWRFRHDSRVRFFLGLACASLIMILGVWPIFDVVTALPILNHTANHRLLLVWQFSVAALAGIVTDLMMRTEQAAEETIPAGFLAVVAGLSALPLVLWLVPELGIVPREPSTLPGARHACIVGGGALGLFWLFRNGKMSRRAWGILACVLTFCDLYTFGGRYNPAVNRDRVFSCVPGSIQFLQRQEGMFRVAADEWLMLVPNTAMVYGLYDVRGYELPVPARLLSFFAKGLHGTSDGALYLLKTLSAPTLRLLSLANVRYLLSAHDLADSGLNLQRVYAGEVNIYENRGVLPRAFIVHQIQVAADGDTALQAVVDEGTNLERVAIVEGDQPGVDQLPLMPDPMMQDPGESRRATGCVERAEITRYDPRDVRLQVDLCQAGLVVLTDTFYAGWRVDVDGAQRPLYPTDYLFRGVFAEAGHHELHFAYDPLSYKVGSALSIASAVGVLLLVVFG
jgi:hypothetical protein